MLKKCLHINNIMFYFTIVWANSEELQTVRPDINYRLSHVTVSINNGQFLTKNITVREV